MVECISCFKIFEQLLYCRFFLGPQHLWSHTDPLCSARCRRLYLSHFSELRNPNEPRLFGAWLFPLDLHGGGRSEWVQPQGFLGSAAKSRMRLIRPVGSIPGLKWNSAPNLIYFLIPLASFCAWWIYLLCYECKFEWMNNMNLLMGFDLIYVMIFFFLSPSSLEKHIIWVLPYPSRYDKGILNINPWYDKGF